MKGGLRILAAFPRKSRLRKRAAVQRARVMRNKYIFMVCVSSLLLWRGEGLVVGGWCSTLSLGSNVPYFGSIGILCSGEGIVLDSS